MADTEEDEVPEDSCPICGEADFSCEHVALTFVPGDRITGGATSAAAGSFLRALDRALVESARSGVARIEGPCRDLCLRAVTLARRRNRPVDPEDAPSELDAGRWELLEEILSRVPGVEVRDFESGYGGFCAEDSGRVAWAVTVERVAQALQDASETLTI